VSEQLIGASPATTALRVERVLAGRFAQVAPSGKRIGELNAIQANAGVASYQRKQRRVGAGLRPVGWRPASSDEKAQMRQPIDGPARRRLDLCPVG